MTDVSAAGGSANQPRVFISYYDHIVAAATHGISSLLAPGRLRSVDRALNRVTDGAHQLSHATAYDRYPALFRTTADLVASARCANGPRRVLSFGCSTGHEAATLSDYFPDADVVGVDISERVLAKARRAWADRPRLSFAHSGDLEACGGFDAAYALSVLCRHRDTKDRDDIADVYPFVLFERAATRLASAVRPGGLLVIYNANYRFADVPASAAFEPIEIEADDQRRGVAVTVFDRKGRRLVEQPRKTTVWRRR